MNENHIVHFGNQNEYLVQGAFFLAGGVMILFAVPFLGVLFLFVSICFFSIHSGLEFDVKNKNARKYHRLFGSRYGPWLDMNEVAYCRLQFYSDQGLMFTRSHSRKVQYRTFDLIFTLKTGEDLEFNDFLDYQTAIKVCAILEQDFDLKIQNDIANQMKSKRRR